MNNVIINPEYSNNTKIYDYNKKISRLINDELNKVGIKSQLVNTSNNVINYINKIKDNNSIIITNGLDNSDIEIIYGLNKNDNLVSRLAVNFEDNNFNVTKYYQRRDINNTSLDYDEIIREFPNNESIIIRYGNLNDNYINNRIDELVSIVVNTLKSYLGLSNDIYIVKKGDNIYSIARKYNTTVDNIKKLNNLTSNFLNIGDKLIIKSIPSTNNKQEENGNYYIVKSGDTLYSIATKYNITIDELKKINNLSNDILSVGQKLKIESSNIEESNKEYKVKSGDTLYSIARKYNITVNDIKKLNNLNSNILSIGQKLKIPNSNNIIYTVKKGDNLYQISNKYGVNIKDIMNINNLKSTNLSIGQKLYIPNKS